MLSPLILAACNEAPLEYRSDDFAPDGQCPWDHPTSCACDDPDRADDPENVELDGFVWCSHYPKQIVPIDHPIFASCDDASVAEQDQSMKVFAVFDGLIAHAYSTDVLVGRELVHEVWNEVPILVDW